MEYRNVIFNAARDGKLRRLKGFLENRPAAVVHDLLSSSSNGATPLVIAAKNGHLDVIDYILSKCNDGSSVVEQVGNVEFDGETIEGAPPLWCAAAAGHYKVVRALVEYGANVNSTTKSKSTPLRAACYDGHLDVVSYLVSAGADIEIANRHGHTCLMIACYKNRYLIANFLIQHKADVNRKSIKGNTALHDCAESGSLKIMKLLLANGARMEMDSYGLTPLMAAALTGHTAIVEMIITMPVIERAESIDALELLGSTYVDKKRDMMGSLDFWRRAMDMRAGDSYLPPLPKKNVCREPCLAYENAAEATSAAELDELFSDPDQMRMQALLVRERILGPAHPDTSYYIRYRGAVYADMGNFQRCILLWMHALDMQQKYLEPLSPMTQSSLLSFVELFSFMMSKDVSALRFSDLFAIFQRALRDLQNSGSFLNGGSMSENERMNLHRSLVIILHFLGLLTRIQDSLSAEQLMELKRALYRLVTLDPRGRNNWSLLHLATIREASCSSTSSRIPLAEFPVSSVVALLLEVGASPILLDKDGCTPLHLAALNKNTDPATFQLLLNHGAHLDWRDDKGDTAIGLLGERGKFLEPLKHITLQCLCARVIRKSEVRYEGCLSKELEEFVKIH